MTTEGDNVPGEDSVRFLRQRLPELSARIPEGYRPFSLGTQVAEGGSTHPDRLNPDWFGRNGGEGFLTDPDVPDDFFAIGCADEHLRAEYVVLMWSYGNRRFWFYDCYMGTNYQDYSETVRQRYAEALACWDRGDFGIRYRLGHRHVTRTPPTAADAITEGGPLRGLLRKYNEQSEGAACSELLLAAIRVLGGDAPLDREREIVRRTVSVSPASIDELSAQAARISGESPEDAYAFREILQAAAVASCCLLSRVEQSVALAISADREGHIDRARYAYEDAFEGKDIALSLFNSPVSGPVPDAILNAMRSFREHWENVHGTSEPTNCFRFDSPQGAISDWMNLVLWNSDFGGAQGLIAQSDVTLRFGLRLQVLDRPKTDVLRPIVTEMSARMLTVGSETDKLLRARCLITLGDALMEAREWTLAGPILHRAYDLEGHEHPVGVHAATQEARCALMAGNAELCREKLGGLETRTMEALAPTLVTMGAELARYLAIDALCRVRLGGSPPVDAGARISDLLRRTSIIARGEAQDRMTHLRAVYFSLLARDVEDMQLQSGLLA